MRPTQQRITRGEAGTPQQVMAARQEQREARMRATLRAAGVPNQEEPVVPASPPAPVEPRFGRAEIRLPEMDYVYHRDIRIEHLNADVIRQARDQMMQGAYRAMLGGDFIGGLDRAFAGQFGKRESPEERKRREQEREAANQRALGLLRDAGPDGQLLADGEAALVPSPTFPELTYGIVPADHGMVHVFQQRLGMMGKVCIQPREAAPLADVLLTRLMLCKTDEKQLWTIGNFHGGETIHFLPKQIREWTKGNRNGMGMGMGGMVFGYPVRPW